MKMKWEEPKICVEAFEANEYVAACGQTEYGAYKFKCDAAAGSLYIESNGREGLQTDGFFGGGSDDYIGVYSPCKKTHETYNRADFRDGYVKNGKSVEKVIVWRGENGRNGHATKYLNRDEWDVVRS